MGLKQAIKFSLLAFLIAGCANLKTRRDVRDKGAKTTPTVSAPSTSSGTSTPSFPSSPAEDEDFETSPAPEEEPPLTTAPTMRIPKVGLILGPGAARVYAQIGVLQELQREKVPVVAVGGIEWGAVVAALYSNKGLANEAEWQMSKLKSEDFMQRSLIGGRSGPAAASAASDFLKSAFGPMKAENVKIPFACPAHNLAKNQIFLMSRGAYTQLLPFCMAYPPIFQPWQGNVSAMRDVKMLADHLRSKGATTIVLVNVLGNPDPARPVAGEAGSTESVLWNEIAAYYAKPLRGVDHVLTIPLGNRGLLAFDDRREILHQGSEKGGPLVKQLARRLGL
ncbi:MAG: patatin-like phospholipase family protein [Bdellovibrionaceae bacterium]|nr:patatin-like phospholipase family protein [Pseudobdellovibrionaceae bacterium]